MTNWKVVRASPRTGEIVASSCPSRLDRTRELPALDDSASRIEPEAPSTDAVPREINDGDVIVPAQCSIESSLAFELLRLQSMAADEEEKS